MTAGLEVALVSCISPRVRFSVKQTNQAPAAPDERESMAKKTVEAPSRSRMYLHEDLVAYLKEQYGFDADLETVMWVGAKKAEWRKTARYRKLVSENKAAPRAKKAAGTTKKAAGTRKATKPPAAKKATKAASPRKAAAKRTRKATAAEDVFD